MSRLERDNKKDYYRIFLSITEFSKRGGEIFESDKKKKKDNLFYDYCGRYDIISFKF